jgi:hypothetical protein
MGESRRFLSAVGATLGAATLRVEALEGLAGGTDALSSEGAARDESRWAPIQAAFDVNRDYVNLVTGVGGGAPKAVTRAIFDTYARINAFR